MTLSATNLTPHVGAEVKSDLATLLSGKAAAEIRALLFDRGVLVFRGIEMNDAQQLAFAETLGTVRQEGHNKVMKVAPDEKNDPLQAAYIQGTYVWHMDNFYEKVPAFGVVMTPRVLAPTGGQTEFSSCCAAYRDLPDAEKTYLGGLSVVYTMSAFMRAGVENPSEEFRQSWDKFPARTRPLIQHHRSGRKALVVNTTAESVVGMSPAESKALLQRLLAWATQPQYVYRHEWRLGDIVIWDNTGSNHRVVPYDFNCGRRHHRVSVHPDQEPDGEDDFKDKEMMNRVRGGKTTVPAG